MSIRNRYTDVAPWIAVAIGLAVVALFSLSYAVSKGHQRADEQYQTEKADYAAYQQHQRDCLRRQTVSVAEIKECLGSYVGPDREQERAEQDLNAQRDMAYWAESMLWASWVTIVVTSIGVLYVALTLKEAKATTAAAAEGVEQSRRANDIASDAVFQDQRPWLDFTMKVSRAPEDTSTHGIVIWVTVEISNCGKTPAKNVRIAGHAWPVNALIIIFRPDRGTNWLNSRNNSMAETDGGFIIFPNQTVTKNYYFTMDRNELAHVARLTMAQPASVEVHGTARVYYKVREKLVWTEKSITIGALDENGKRCPFRGTMVGVEPSKIVLDHQTGGSIT